MAIAAMREPNSWQRLQLILSFVAVAGGLVALTATVIAIPKQLSILRGPVVSPAPPVVPHSKNDEFSLLAMQVDVLAKRLHSLDARLSKAESTIYGLAKIRGKVPANSAIVAQLNALHARLVQTDNDLASVNRVIISNPDNTADVQLLHKDMKNMKETYQSNLTFLKEELTRVRALGEWFIVLMITIAGGLVSLAISSVLRVLAEGRASRMLKDA
jgi:hypothetical protein